MSTIAQVLTCPHCSHRRDLHSVRHVFATDVADGDALMRRVDVRVCYYPDCSCRFVEVPQTFDEAVDMHLMSVGLRCDDAQARLQAHLDLERWEAEFVDE